MTYCSGCKLDLPDAAFFVRREAGRVGKLRTPCRGCANKRTVEWQYRNPEKARASAKRTRTNNRARISRRGREQRRANPQLSVFKSRRIAARRSGIEFTVRFEEIVWPEFCPVLGIRLEYTAGRGQWAIDASASIDRVHCDRPYESGNVAVISLRANRVKNNGTAQEHIRIARWMEEQR